MQHRFERLMKDRVSFWSEVHEPFMNHDITGKTCGSSCGKGLAHTRGNYKMLVRAFNMDPRDYKRFLELPADLRVPRVVPSVPHDGRLRREANSRWRARRGPVVSYGRVTLRFALRVGRRRAYDLLACHAKGDLSSTVRTSIVWRRESPDTERHFTRYFGDLLSIKLRSRLRSPAQVEDARQETFLRVHEGASPARRHSVPGGFGAFVNSVCNNVLFEMYRSHSKTTPLEEEAGAAHSGSRHGCRDRGLPWTRTEPTSAPSWKLCLRRSGSSCTGCSSRKRQRRSLPPA